MAQFPIEILITDCTDELHFKTVGSSTTLPDGTKVTITTLMGGAPHVSIDRPQDGGDSRRYLVDLEFLVRAILAVDAAR